MTTKVRSKSNCRRSTGRSSSLSARGEGEQDPAGRLRHVLHPYDRQLTLSNCASVKAAAFTTGTGRVCKHATSRAGQGSMTSILKHHYVVNSIEAEKDQGWWGSATESSFCGSLWGHQLLQSPPQQVEPPDRVRPDTKGHSLPGARQHWLRTFPGGQGPVGCRETVLPWASLFFPFLSQALNLNKHTTLQQPCFVQLASGAAGIWRLWTKCELQCEHMYS